MSSQAQWAALYAAHPQRDVIPSGASWGPIFAARLWGKRSRGTCFSESEAAERTSRMGTCFSRPSLTRRNGCPILATLLSLWPGWDCTNPTHTQPSLAKRFSAESNGDLLLLLSSRRDLGFIYGRSRGLQAPEKRPQTNPGFSPGVLYQGATPIVPSEGYGLQPVRPCTHPPTRSHPERSPPRRTKSKDLHFLLLFAEGAGAFRLLNQILKEKWASAPEPCITVSIYPMPQTERARAPRHRLS